MESHAEEPSRDRRRYVPTAQNPVQPTGLDQSAKRAVDRVFMWAEPRLGIQDSPDVGKSLGRSGPVHRIESHTVATTANADVVCSASMSRPGFPARRERPHPAGVSAR